MWDAEELKIPYFPANIVELEITIVDTPKMLVLIAEVSYEFALNGRVGASPTQRVYRLSDFYSHVYSSMPFPY